MLKSLHALQRFWDLSGVVLVRGGIIKHHFQDYKQNFFLKGRAEKPVFSQSTSGNRVIDLNDEDCVLFFVVYKTLYK